MKRCNKLCSGRSARRPLHNEPVAPGLGSPYPHGTRLRHDYDHYDQPYVVMIGAREAAAGSISLRERTGQRELPLSAALAELSRLCALPTFAG